MNLKCVIQFNMDLSLIIDFRHELAEPVKIKHIIASRYIAVIIYNYLFQAAS